MTSSGITAVVLAAGNSSRFGQGDKLIAPLSGIPIVRRSVEAAVRVGFPDFVVVTGLADVREALLGLDVRFCAPPAGTMGASIAAGVSASPDAQGWLIWPADMPVIRSGSARRVVEAFDPAAPVVPVHDGRRGHPVLFPARFRQHLEALILDRGARDVLRAAAHVVEVEVDDPGIHVDVDTVEDLARAERLVR